VRNFLLASGLIITSFFYSCSEEKPDYTVVQTGSICRIDDKNVIFTARILNKTDQIEEYGFKWYLVAEGTAIARTYIVTYRGEPEGEYFESTISSGMRADTTYNLQAYVRTSQGISYGRTVTFRSLGSEAPEAYGFMPNPVSTGDTITIWGRYFGYNKLDASVWYIKTDLSSGGALRIIRLTNDTILATVSNHLGFTEAYLNVRILDSQTRLPGILNFE
jgi:hypothetical protein